jgi:DNA-binding MarR family transcriptional regulator
VEFEHAPNRLRALPSWLLAQSAAQANRAVSKAVSESGASRSHYAALASLEEFGPLNQAALSDHIGLDRSDVVRLVDELAAAKLVVRDPDPGDRRRNIVTLTTRGRQRLAQLDDLLAQAQTEALDRLDRAERVELVKLLSRLLGASSDPGRPGANMG